MNIDANVLVLITEANQNFQAVDIQKIRQKLFEEAADSVIAENIEALIELAKRRQRHGRKRKKCGR